MGETISTLVFRPPPPTQIKANKYFYIRIPYVDDTKQHFICANATCGAINNVNPGEMDSIFSDSNRKSGMENDVVDNNSLCKDESGRYGNGSASSHSPNQNKQHGKNTLNTNTNNNNNKKNKNNPTTNNNNNKDEASFISSLSIGTADEYKIPAFFLRRKGAKVTILFSHGNAEDLGMMFRRMKEMAMLLCANVLAYDYTGYGLSTPANVAPSEQLCYRNIDAAYHHLTNVMRIPPAEIVLYGRSLGSGPSCYLAKKSADEGESVAGLILHSPFLSIYRIVIDCRINLVGDMFVNKSKAKDVRYVFLF